MNFIAIDVETANCDYSSICQIGLAYFDNGILVDKWKSYINPEDYFDSFNVSIHSIDESTVCNSPTFKEIFPLLSNKLSNRLLVHHMAFDKISINRAIQKYNLPSIEAVWLDSAKLARRTWEDVAYRGYGLESLASKFNISFQHHDALEDAIAAGKITQLAFKSISKPLEEVIELLQKRKPRIRNKEDLRHTGNPNGEYYGESIVFTGSMDMLRHEAADLASEVGFSVENNVTKKTTILVLGSLDFRVLNGKEKSNKQIKAESLILKGANLKVITEEDFLELIS